MTQTQMERNKIYCKKQKLDFVCSDDNELIYCSYCKEPIYPDEESIRRKHGWKHKKCQSEEAGIVDELFF